MPAGAGVTSTTIRTMEMARRKNVLDKLLLFNNLSRGIASLVSMRLARIGSRE